MLRKKNNNNIVKNREKETKRNKNNRVFPIYNYTYIFAWFNAESISNSLILIFFILNRT